MANKNTIETQASLKGVKLTAKLGADAAPMVVATITIEADSAGLNLNELDRLTRRGLVKVTIEPLQIDLGLAGTGTEG